MNYGKRSTSKKRNALISRTSMLEKRAHVSFIRVLFTALIAVCVMVVCLGIGSFRGVIAGAPDVNDVDISPLGYATFLYDDQGTQIRQLSAPTSNRLPVSLDQIPVSLHHAVVSIEDERFYEHNGIDVRGILRAGVKALTSGGFSEGASTITQQLLKNSVFDFMSEDTLVEKIERKLQEQYLFLVRHKIESAEELVSVLDNLTDKKKEASKEKSKTYKAKERFKDIFDKAEQIRGLDDAESCYQSGDTFFEDEHNAWERLNTELLAQGYSVEEVESLRKKYESKYAQDCKAERAVSKELNLGRSIWKELTVSASAEEKQYDKETIRDRKEQPVR